MKYYICLLLCVYMHICIYVYTYMYIHTLGPWCKWQVTLYFILIYMLSTYFENSQVAWSHRTTQIKNYRQSLRTSVSSWFYLYTSISYIIHKISCICSKICPTFPGGSDIKESACNAGYLGSVPVLGRSPGEGNGNPLQYSYSPWSHKE